MATPTLTVAISKNEDGIKEWALQHLKAASLALHYKSTAGEDDQNVAMLFGDNALGFSQNGVDVKHYNLIQNFEGPKPQTDTVGPCLVTAAIEPADGMDAELEDWYRKQHLDMLSMCRGFRRTTRWKLFDLSETENGPVVPRYFAIHEYDSTNVPTDQWEVVSRTEWSIEVMKGVKVLEVGTWGLVDVLARQDGVKLGVI